MKQIIWGSYLETGIPAIDTQHKRLFALVNQMRETREKKNMNAVAAVITEMVDYTISHLAFEEALLKEAGYPFLRIHKRVHKLFIQRIPEFQARFAAGEDITEALHDMLSNWLVNHIKGEDHVYVKCIKEYLARKKSGASLPKPVALQVASAKEKAHPGFWQRLKIVFKPE